jgi:hypothetical protein
MPIDDPTMSAWQRPGRGRRGCTQACARFRTAFSGTLAAVAACWRARGLGLPFSGEDAWASPLFSLLWMGPTHKHYFN